MRARARFLSAPRVTVMAGAMVVMLAAGCGGGSTQTPMTSATTPPTAQARDVHSYARPDEVRVTHVALDLTADFATQELAGRAALDLSVSPGASRLVLDTFDLAIRQVTTPDGHTLRHTLAKGGRDSGSRPHHRSRARVPAG